MNFRSTPSGLYDNQSICIMKIHCQKCGYDLNGLQEHRCPECGTDFSPDDPETFLTRPVSGMRDLLLAVGAVLLICAPLGGARLIDSGHLVLPTFLNAVAPLGSIMIICGLGLAFHVALHSYRALTGKIPWIAKRQGFIAAFAISGSLYLGLTGFLVYGILKWILKA